MFVLDTLCMTLFTTSSVAVFEAAIWVKSMHIIIKDVCSRTEYLLPTDCIIVLDAYFNFTKKSNVVGNL